MTYILMKSLKTALMLAGHVYLHKHACAFYLRVKVQKLEM